MQMFTLALPKFDEHHRNVAIESPHYLLAPKNVEACPQTEKILVVTHERQRWQEKKKEKDLRSLII